LKTWLKKLKLGLAKELKKKHRQPIGACGPVGVSLRKGRGNFIKGDSWGRKLFSRVLKIRDV
jgi:hypothetical protein